MSGGYSSVTGMRALGMHAFRLRTICVVTLLVLGAAGGFAAEIHGIFVIDTSDASIGQSVEKDMDNVIDFLEKVSQQTGMALNTYRVIGSDMTRENVARQVQDLQPNPDDMVMFYYSGHGFRTESADTKYPFISLNDSSVDAYWVLEELYGKRPRFTMVVIDSCNNILPDSYTPPPIERKSVPGVNVAANYRALFVESEGAIITSSSVPGQYSMALQDGGAYTLELLRSIELAAQGNNPSWEGIMSAASQPIVFGGGTRQDPQFDILPANVELSGDMFAAPVEDPAE